MDNFRNSNGQLCIAIFSNEIEFRNETPCWSKIYNKDQLINNEILLIIPFKKGRWGISVLDDENKNGKMDYKLFGIPCEGFGFSNFTLKGIKRPNFNDFSFELGITDLSMQISLKYL